MRQGITGDSGIDIGDHGERLVIKCSMNWTVSTHMRHGITCDSIVGDRGEMPVIKCSMNWTVSTHMRHGITGDGGVGDRGERLAIRRQVLQRTVGFILLLLLLLKCQHNHLNIPYFTTEDMLL